MRCDSKRNSFAMRMVFTAVAAALVFACVALAGCTANEEETYQPIEEVMYDHVVDLGVLTEIDMDAAEAYYKDRYDHWNEGGCSAFAKTLEDGDTVVARNLDLTISNKPAYVFRTAFEGKRKTIGITYSYTFGDDFDVVVEKGVESSLLNALPFVASDFINEDGLYVEMNMRTDETDKDGNSVFGCKGTNPGAEERVCSDNLPFYIAQNCSTIEEALDYVDSLDIYTMKADFMNWNFCFMMSDATGRYGVLEIACDKVVWHEGEPCQTNFYITPEFAEKEKYGAGIGRYETIMAGYDDVKNEGDMLSLINKVTYFQTFYDPEDQQYDTRSECVNEQANNKDLKDDWTTEFVLDPKNEELVRQVQAEDREEVKLLSKQGLRDAGKYWVSVLTVQGNSTEKTLKVRFFEDDITVTRLGFDF